MGEQTPIAILTSASARAAMVELGAWAANLGDKLRELAEVRSVFAPAIVYRFSHPVRRALPTTQASVKLWEAYPPAWSDSGVWEIHLHPRTADPRAIVVAALAGLASATAGPDAKFGRDYGKVAARLGLAPGPSRRWNKSWRNAVVDPTSQATVDRIADSLGPFPLGALEAGKAQRRRPDRNLRKAVCPTCGPIGVRLSRKAFRECIYLCGGTHDAPHVPARVGLAGITPSLRLLNTRPS